METLAKKVEKNNGKKVLRFCTLLFSIMILSTISVLGESNPKNNESSGSTVNADADATSTEIKKEAEHEEMMGYIYMVVGFVVIIGVAWFAVAGKRKKGEEETNTNHHPHIKHHHGVDHKKYGTNSHRG